MPELVVLLALVLLALVLELELVEVPLLEVLPVLVLPVLVLPVLVLPVLVLPVLLLLVLVLPDAPLLEALVLPLLPPGSVPLIVPEVPELPMSVTGGRSSSAHAITKAVTSAAPNADPRMCFMHPVQSKDPAVRTRAMNSRLFREIAAQMGAGTHQRTAKWPHGRVLPRTRSEPYARAASTLSKSRDRFSWKEWSVSISS